MTNCNKIFEISSPPLTHRKITTSPLARASMELPRGSSKAIRSRSGNHPGQVLWIHEKRQSLLSITLLQNADGLFFVAGAGKSMLWYVHLSICLEKSSSWPAPTLRAPSMSCMIEDSLIIQDIDAMRKRGLLSFVLFQLRVQSDSYCDILSDFYITHCHDTQNPSE